MLTVDYDRLGLTAGERLLDIGCGFGRHTYEGVKRGASVVSCDLGVDELEGVRAIVAAMAADDEIPDGVACMAVNGDATALPFPDASFERVIASEVVEHIADDGRAFAELARVLKPGGTLAVTVPGWLAERICWALSDEYPAPKSPGGHVRIYSRTALHDRLHSSNRQHRTTHTRCIRPTGGCAARWVYVSRSKSTASSMRTTACSAGRSKSNRAACN